MGLLSNFPWPVQFSVLFVPLTIYIWIAAPSIKWKLLLTFGSAVGVILALSGKSMKGLTPVGRNY